MLKDRFGVGDDIVFGQSGDVGSRTLEPVENLRDKTRKVDQNTLLVEYDNELGDEKYQFEVWLRPFRVFQRINGRITAIVNHRDSLYFESTLSNSIESQAGIGECLKRVLETLDVERAAKYFDSDNNGNFKPMMAGGASTDFDFKEAYSLGVFVPSRNLFGLPERPDSFKLKFTDGQGDEPYRMQGLDVFPHSPYSKDPLYSSMPYLTGHNTDVDISVLLLTAAETWVDLI
jgi:hypothetical protein